MIDDTETQHQDAETSTRPGTDSGARTGFCQECGQGLTVSTLRRVGNGIFCETCAAFRQTGTGWQNVHGGTYAGGTGTAVPIPGSGPNPVLAGDVLLLCSDGLHGAVSATEIAEVAGSGGDLQAAARKLVELANERDGSDNVSAQLIRIRGVERVGMYRGRPYKLR